MTGRSNTKGECHHGGPRHRDPVLAAGSGGHPSDGPAIWPVLSAIAFHILADREDSRETVNDTYLRAWDSMPPHRPQVLATYLGRITRQLSIDRWRARGRAKRGGSQYALSLEELGDCVSGAATPEEALDLAELGRAIGDYLRTLPLPARRAFLCRYYYADSLAETARVCGISVPAVKSQLYRTRQGLRTYLEKEGFDV